MEIYIDKNSVRDLVVGAIRSSTVKLFRDDDDITRRLDLKVDAKSIEVERDEANLPDVSTLIINRNRVVLPPKEEIAEHFLESETPFVFKFDVVDLNNNVATSFEVHSDGKVVVKPKRDREYVIKVISRMIDSSHD